VTLCGVSADSPCFGSLQVELDIRQKISQVDSLPSPPMLAAELLDLTSREDVRISQIATLIERDPAMSAKLLRLCNSAAFGLRQKVSSLDRAMVMLGIRQVRCLALGFMILNESQMKQSERFDFAHYWRRASVTAVSARAMADHALPTMSGEAFVAGLVQDIGVLLLQHVATDAYNAVLQAHQSGAKRLHEVEESVLGITHMEAGERLLESWGLPEIICVPVGVHHCPQTFDGDPEVAEFVQIVATASEMANLFCEPNKSESLDRVLRVCASYFRMGEEDTHDLLKRVGDDAQETAWLFEIQSADGFDYEHIRAQARKELELAASENA
jgi:HD-like signal output (HDOD) protein